jgi:hypothetical protein
MKFGVNRSGQDIKRKNDPSCIGGRIKTTRGIPNTRTIGFDSARNYDPICREYSGYYKNSTHKLDEQH